MYERIVFHMQEVFYNETRMSHHMLLLMFDNEEEGLIQDYFQLVGDA